MSKFLKHFFRSLRRAPLQPLLILLTVMLSVATATAAVTTMRLVAEQVRETARLHASLGDLLISMRGNADTSFLFEEDAKQALGEGDRVIGEFALTAFTERNGKTEAVRASAVDLIAADRFFGFSYLEMRVIPASEAEFSAIVSERIAEEYGWKVGDTVALKVLGNELTYRIQSVAENTGLLVDRDILLSRSGIIRVLAERFMLLSVLSPGLLPSTRLIVRLENPAAATEVCSHLLSLASFADKNVRVTNSDSVTDYVTMIEQMVLRLLTAVLALFAAFLISTALRLSEQEKHTDRILFRYAGATARQMAGIQLSESAFIALTGSVGGLLLAYPMTAFLCREFVWFKGDVRIGADGWAVGIALSFLLVSGSTALRIFATRKDPLPAMPGEADLLPRRSESPRAVLLFGIPAILFSVGIFLIPLRFRYFVAIPTIFFLTLFLYRAFPLLFGVFLRLLQAVWEKAAHHAGYLWIALRTARNRFSVAHVGRLLALTLAFFLLVAVSVRGITLQTEIFENAVIADFCAVQLPSSAQTLLADRTTYAATAKVSVFPNVESDRGVNFTAISVSGSPEACLHPKLIPERLPKGNEIVLSAGAAALLDAAVGDEVTLTVQGVTCRLQVIGTDGSNLLYIDANALGLLGNGLTCVKLAPDADPAEAAGRLEAAGAILTEKDVLFAYTVRPFRGFVWMIRVFAALSFSMMLISCANVFSEQHRAGKGDRERAMLAGGTRTAVRLWELTESLLLLFAAAVCGLALGYFFCQLLFAGALSLGFTMPGK